VSPDNDKMGQIEAQKISLNVDPLFSHGLLTEDVHARFHMIGDATIVRGTMYGHSYLELGSHCSLGQHGMALRRGQLR
jgi:hypothetical protein